MITQFTVGASRTINLGNFESMRVEASVTIDLNEGENFDDCKIGAHRELRKLLEETYRNLTKKDHERIESNA
jgi:hypothetical protein